LRKERQNAEEDFYSPPGTSSTAALSTEIANSVPAWPHTSNVSTPVKTISYFTSQSGLGTGVVTVSVMSKNIEKSSPVWFIRASNAQLTKNPLSTKASEPNKLFEGAKGHFLRPNCLGIQSEIVMAGTTNETTSLFSLPAPSDNICHAITCSHLRDSDYPHW